MIIAKNAVVEFHYTLTEDGKELETSRNDEPLVILHGFKGMLAAVENALLDKQAGDKFEITLTPEQGYGDRREDSMQRIPMKHLQGAKKWKPGMTATLDTDQGRRQVTVVKVGKFNVDCDTNHPFAGKTLTFDIEIVSVREALPEEIAHGHVHGKGGHHH